MSTEAAKLDLAIGKALAILDAAINQIEGETRPERLAAGTTLLYAVRDYLEPAYEEVSV